VISRAPKATGVVSIAVIVGAAVLAGALVATGAGGALAVAAAIAILSLLLLGRRIVPVFLGALGVLLILYAFLGRGVAHVGVGPVFIGELALVLAVPATLVSLPRARLGWLHVTLTLFIAWGALQTIPYIGRYGIDALRDSVTWSYAFFAIAVSVTVTPDHLARVVRTYRRMALPLAIWIPVSAILTLGFTGLLPTAPGSDVPIVYFKPGDAGVQMAGLAAFVLVGLYAWRGAMSALSESILWLFWIAAVAVSSAISRGGMLATATAATSLLFVRSATRWISIGAVVMCVLAAGLLFDPTFRVGDYRAVSFGQLVENVNTILSDEPGTSGQATKVWRLAWWDKIIGYTIDGPYFWTGKGYGINLADADGFQVLADRSLRAPHSSHFEILARSGVPGLVLWLILQASWAAAMLASAIRARRNGRTWWLAVIAWLFVYWLAAIVNMSFDVYLGGPQGGIWFWAILGAGIAVTRIVREGEPDPAATRTEESHDGSGSRPVPLAAGP